MDYARALLGDPRGQWTTKNYLLPLLNVAYADVVLNLKNGSGKELMAVITVPGVPAGTTSLYPWQNGTAAPGQAAGAPNPAPLLAGLFDPIEVYVKPAGQPVWFYSKVRPVDELPHVNPLVTASVSLGPLMWWSWMGNQLRLTPVMQPLDIEVTGRFNAPPLVDDNDLLTAHEDVWLPTAYQTTALVGVERSNPAILAGYAAKALSTQDNVIAAIIRSGQGSPKRFQRMSRETGGGLWYWG